MPLQMNNNITFTLPAPPPPVVALPTALPSPLPGSPEFKSTTLFVGDLSIYCTEMDLQKVFVPFGAIEAVRIKKGSHDKLNLSYGFVKYYKREDAEAAMAAKEGSILLGRAMK
jgi:RNA recognition motif-containing protein